MEETVTLKVVLLGSSGVGKTSIINQFISNKFDPDCLASLSAQFVSKTMNYNDINKSIRFDIWDTAGQEQYRSLAKIFYKDAKIIVFVYDITSPDSFNDLRDFWYKETKNESDPDAILALVGNKDDKISEQVVDVNEAQDFAKEMGAIFQKTSALTNYGIDNLFRNLGYKYFNPNFDIEVSDKKAKAKYEAKQKEEAEKKKKRYKLKPYQNDDNQNDNQDSKRNKRKCCF